MNCRAFPCAVAVVGLVASVLLFGRPLAAAAEPFYLRIVVSPTCTVYVDFTQPEMRVAAAPGQFDAAAPENAASGWTEFPEIVLPVPSEALPGGFTKATATFTLIAFRGRPGPSAREEPMRVFGSLRLGRPDSNGVLWTYSTPVSAELGAAPEQAPAIQVPEIKSLTLSLVTNASRRQVGAGLRVMSGKAAVEEILRDGKPAQARVKLLDSRGKVVASAAGPLSNFGFG